MTTQDVDQFDLICVGFGKKGLALATALADKDPKSNVLILERRTQFDESLNFASGERQGGSPFLQDLITQHNPKSKYTYINFLHQSRLLLGFTNASQMTPSRTLTSMYMTWAAEQIAGLGWVNFGQEVLRIQPQSSIRGQVQRWLVDIQSVETSATWRVSTKRIIVATGARKHLPEAFSSACLQPYILPMHSSEHLMQRLYQKGCPLHVAIIGADQEAAELFELLHNVPGQHKASMFFRGTALRADDNTPFSRATIDGSWSSMQHLPPEIRQRIVATSVSKEFPTIDLPTLERLYVSHYSEKIRSLDHSTHRFQMCHSQEIVHAQVKDDKITLLARNTLTGEESLVPGSFDVVMASFNRGRLAAESILEPVASLYAEKHLSVSSSYAVNLRDGTIASDCGIWVMGSLLDRHARRDDFSILSSSAQRAVKSLSECSQRPESREQNNHAMAVL